jgi:hypothetical protein
MGEEALRARRYRWWAARARRRGASAAAAAVHAQQGGRRGGRAGSGRSSALPLAEHPGARAANGAPPSWATAGCSASAAADLGALDGLQFANAARWPAAERRGAGASAWACGAGRRAHTLPREVAVLAVLAVLAALAAAWLRRSPLPWVAVSNQLV